MTNPSCPSMTATLEKVCSMAFMSLALLFIFIISSQVSAFSLTNCTLSRPQNQSQELKVLCYKMDFLRVPSQIPTNVKYLDISYNKISHIRVEDFEDLLNLRYLNSSNSKISYIQEGTAEHFPKLTHLNLANNKLERVSSGLLRGLVSLEVLRLDGNKIKSIDKYAFITLQNMVVLNLTNNDLQQIAKVKPVLMSQSLEELYIGGNHIDVFNSDDLSRTNLSLRKIDFADNPLTKFQITEDIFPKLEYLDISYCGQNKSVPMIWNITDKSYLNSVKALNLSAMRIPKENISAILHTISWASLFKLRVNDLKWIKLETLLQYACLPGIQVLRLRRNEIPKLTPAMLAPCSNLTELDFGENKIAKISASLFKELTQLKVLYLKLNKLSSINNSFAHLPMLEIIDLSRNRISRLSCSDFANLTRLNQLSLYDNKIYKLPACVFKGLNNLEILKLGTNKLLTIDTAFANLPSLKNLQLAYNKLSTLSIKTFNGLPSLRILDLGENQISKIEENAFEGLLNLTDLLMSSNRLENVKNPKVFLGMPNLQTLELFSNLISYSEDTLRTPPFKHLKSLRVLSIHSQRRGINKIPSNLLEGLTSLEMFSGGSMNLKNLHPDTFNSTPKLWFLDLSKNVFTDDESITAEVFHPIQNLSKLIITRAQIHSLNFLLNARLSRLSTLKVSENVLDVMNKTLIDSLPRLKNLDLRKNTFTCDCSNAFFLDWALNNNYTQVIYLSRYTCSYPLSLKGESVLIVSTEWCNLNIDFIMFVCSSVTVILTLLVSFINQFFHWQVLYAYYLFLAYLYGSKRKQIHKQHRFQYDAFISYSVQDEPWVVQELLPNLEGEQGWRLCLHHRDFEPGRSIIDNIMDGIYSSRKTICLITDNYLKSIWCSKEIQMANFRLFDEQKDVLILIFLEDIPTHQLSPYYRMRKLVKKKTYLKWPKPGEDTRVFWQKLRQALETKEGPEEEKPLLSGEKECNY